MDDRQVVAAIMAGDPAGLADAYDKYAAPLYGYCRWMLHDPGDAAGALQHTFVIAATKLGGLQDPGKLRPWLYAVARRECHHRLRTAGLSPAADLAGQPAAGRRDAEPAELRRLIRATVDGLNAGDREVIELSLGHDLSDSDLAVVLGMPGSRAHAQASRARGQLDKALGMLLIARTGRKACPALDELLADWDGRLTSQTRSLISRHIEQCQACAGRRPGALRPQALSGLLPLATLPPGLREQVLGLCDGIPRDPARRAGRGRIRGNPGVVTAAAAVIMWAAAAVTATLITFTGSHPAHAQPAHTGAGSSASSTEQAKSSLSPARTPSPTHSPSPSQLPTPAPAPFR